MMRSAASFFFVAIIGVFCADLSSGFRHPVPFALQPLHQISSQDALTPRPFQKAQMGNTLLTLRAGASTESSGYRPDDVINVESVSHLNKILAEAGNQLVVIDFSATWCGPCKYIAPTYHRMASNADYRTVKFLKVDVDEASDVAERFNVMSMPTFVFVKNNNEIHRFLGANENSLVSSVKKFM